MAGIWDGMNRLSSAYLLLLTTSIQVYYLPTLSSILKPGLLWKEIIKTEKIILPLVTLMFIVIFLARGLIIDLLFTQQFYAMKQLFILQLFGDLIKISSWILSYTMYAKAMTKQLIITDNIFTLTFIAFIYFFINKLGLKAVYYGYILNNLVYLTVIYFFLKNYILRRSPQ
jgi:PST family polysaccharide transporter